MLRDELIEASDPLYKFRNASAMERLVNILITRTVYASPMPWVHGDPKAVCFTECIWESLTKLADSYSPYGIVFLKHFIFEKGGGPALYVKGTIIRDLGNQIPDLIKPFIAPFDPNAVIKPPVTLDWLHEREWRLPSSLNFEYSDIEYVIVESIQDADSVVHQIGTQNLPEDKLIPMKVYRNIKSAWRDR